MADSLTPEIAMGRHIAASSAPIVLYAAPARADRACSAARRMQ